MAIKDLVKLNGETRNLPVRREESTQWPSATREMAEWMDQWNRLFDGFFGRAFDLTPWRDTANWGTQWGSFIPAINVVENDKEYSVTAELPGMDENDIELAMNKGALVIKGEKKRESEDKGNGYHRIERSYGTFHRTLPLPQEVDAEKVEATFKKGILTVTLPKLPEAQAGAKKISIKSEGTNR
ncbi:MAG TPA: Hsp20/alpha crystallin family protein [Chloroflexia bacterium]